MKYELHEVKKFSLAPSSAVVRVGEQYRINEVRYYPIVKNKHHIDVYFNSKQLAYEKGLEILAQQISEV